MNAKGADGSNRLLCWACNTPYCYLCRSVVTKGKFAKNHFGKGGCPQHGDKKKQFGMKELLDVQLRTSVVSAASKKVEQEYNHTLAIELGKDS